MMGHPRYTTRMFCEECNIDIFYYLLSIPKLSNILLYRRNKIMKRLTSFSME